MSKMSLEEAIEQKEKIEARLNEIAQIRQNLDGEAEQLVAAHNYTIGVIDALSPEEEVEVENAETE